MFPGKGIDEHLRRCQQAQDTNGDGGVNKILWEEIVRCNQLIPVLSSTNLSSDGVRNEEVDNLARSESCITHASEDGGDIVTGFRNEQVGRR